MGVTSGPLPRHYTTLSSDIITLHVLRQGVPLDIRGSLSALRGPLPRHYTTLSSDITRPTSGGASRHPRVRSRGSSHTGLFSGFGFRVSGFGFRVLGLGFSCKLQSSAVNFWVLGVWCRVSHQRQPCTPNPTPHTPHPTPQTPHPTPHTPHPHPTPHTPHPTPHTPHPKPQTPNPKPQSPNPKTLNPNSKTPI